MKLIILLSVLGAVFANDSFIIGGVDAQPGAWPWQGSLRIGSSHSCGLSLIGQKWGLTAAHCVTGSVGQYNFMFGGINRNNLAVRRVAQSIKRHERYNQGPGAFPNDIALVEFSEPIELTGDVDIIPLTNGETGHSGCYITGWGRDNSGSLPTILQEAPVITYSNPECEVYWGSNINDGHICIGDVDNTRTSCNGDSGGPLVCMTDNGYELVGATSWGPVGCSPTVPAGYTRISYFRDWIRTHSGI